MTPLLRWFAAAAVLVLIGIPAGAGELPSEWIETPVLAPRVHAGVLPPVSRRLPEVPSVVVMKAEGKEPGVHGGSLRLLMGRTKDIRMMVVYGYARLVAYNSLLNLVPDILERIDVEGDRTFTLHLRPGHKWSDGHPFTAEDFRYFWEDMATDPVISPGGPPRQLVVDDEPARFEVIDETTVRYSWSKPNPMFLPALAGALPLYIYRPAHYLKQFHIRYVDEGELQRKAEEAKQRDWRALHFRHDRQYRNDNPEMPSLQPWINSTKMPAQRFVFVRNPYFHRVDANGRQLPYIDQVNMTIASGKLIPAKTGAGETDLQARAITFSNFTFLKQGEARQGYSVRLWPSAKGSKMALYPNLNVDDPVWRRLFRSADFRRALSLAIDRQEINVNFYFGLALAHNNTVLPQSPLYAPEYGTKWATYDPKKANQLLDSLGLTERDANGIRLLPDGRPAEIIVETAGEDVEQVDVLQLVNENWRKVGIKLFTKPSQREVFRNRIFAGSTQMSVWEGLENGVPTADSAPVELAPTSQQQYQWPKWGQYHQTSGQAGEAVDIPEAQRLYQLNQEWRNAENMDHRRQIWQQMLEIHADQVFTIGLIAAVPQPVVVSNRLRNVPKKGIYNWNPGAFFGIFRPDTFWFAKSAATGATRR